MALGDSGPLYQVLGHLVENAIKYSPAGGAIRLRGGAIAEGVRIEVADQGLGLPPDVDIFEPFRQAESGEGQARGVGLGLHIVRTLLEAMDGSVTARPNPDRGATFTVVLPRAP